MVVLLHGVSMNSPLRDTGAAGLRDRYRCNVPELPSDAQSAHSL